MTLAEQERLGEAEQLLLQVLRYGVGGVLQERDLKRALAVVQGIRRRPERLEA